MKIFSEDWCNKMGYIPQDKGASKPNKFSGIAERDILKYCSMNGADGVVIHPVAKRVIAIKRETLEQIQEFYRDHPELVAYRPRTQVNKDRCKQRN